MQESISFPLSCTYYISSLMQWSSLSIATFTAKVSYGITLLKGLES